MTVYGFTGSADHVTQAQEESLLAFVQERMPSLVVHGACVEADTLMDRLAAALCIRRRVRPGHDRHGNSPKYSPPMTPTLCSPVEHYASRPYLARNRDIVDDCVWLIAVPSTFYEVPRSGTWATIRYAKSVRKDHTLILPDGLLQHHTTHDWNY